MQPPTFKPLDQAQQTAKPIKVKIIACNFPRGWYADNIGEEFEVDNAPEGMDYIVWEDYINKSHIWRHIKHEDCERI